MDAENGTDVPVAALVSKLIVNDGEQGLISGFFIHKN
jgi:hypothetical protein